MAILLIKWSMPSISWVFYPKRMWNFLWLMSSLRYSSKKMEALCEFLKFRNSYYDIISKDDPLPILGALKGSLESFEQVLTGRATTSRELIKKN